MSSRRKYTQESEREAVQMSRASGVRLRQVARECLDVVNPFQYLSNLSSETGIHRHRPWQDAPKVLIW